MTTATLPTPTAPRSAPRRTARIAWHRPALVLLLAGTAVLYLWNLGASGTANSFYAAAVQAGSQSWKAMFFGSFDSANFITVDKPPASLWVMEISARLFGFSSWSMLVPQALEGVAAVGLLYATVRRWYGPAAGLLAGAVLALTPVATLMFRFNNPDALLTLLLVAGAYCVIRATERASVRWLLLAGTCVGFGFLTKMLQAFLVLPAFGLVYLVAGPTSLRRRLVHLAAALGAVVVAAGWWVSIVELWPAGSRPYIGGSTTNSVLELTFGYNGLGRIFGNGQPGGGPGGAISGGGGPGGAGGFGGATGLARMFGDAFGTQISWLLPAALIALVLGLWLTRRASRTDRTRAGLLLWGGWLLVTAGTFSFMQGIVHPYYTVVLAPPIGALVAITGRELWRRRENWFARTGLALMVASTAVWSFVLLDRTPSWHPELRYAVLGTGILASVALLVRVRRVALVAVALAIAVGLAGTGAYALDTATTAHTGPIPSAGPAGSDRGSPGGQLAGGGGPGGAGEQVDAAVVALLKSSTTAWAAATNGSQSAAGLQLASGKAIMAIGGFSGGDPAPKLAQFQRYVAAGRIHYYLTGGPGGGTSGGPGGGPSGGPGGGSSGAPVRGGPSGRAGGNDIATWDQSHYTVVTVGGQTIYDLTKPLS